MHLGEVGQLGLWIRLQGFGQEDWNRRRIHRNRVDSGIAGLGFAVEKGYHWKLCPGLEIGRFLVVVLALV